MENPDDYVLQASNPIAKKELNDECTGVKKRFLVEQRRNSLKEPPSESKEP
jgi:hypothetical protein